LEDSSSEDRAVTVEVLKRVGSVEQLNEIAVQHYQEIDNDNRLTLTIRVVRLTPLLLLESKLTSCIRPFVHDLQSLYWYPDSGLNEYVKPQGNYTMWEDKKD